jgi:hypothetical protein
MATTTNYGWTTPDDSALVKDGASAIRTLGSSIDTTVKGLSPGTTAGDVDYYTSSTAKARLAIGTTGQVLTVAGGVPSWATASSGGMTLISTTTLTGATTTLSSIPSTYNSLQIVIRLPLNATDNQELQMRINGDTGSTYIWGSSWAATNGTYGSTNWRITGTIDNAVTQGLVTITIPDYANTSTWKIGNWISLCNDGTTTTSYRLQTGIGGYNQTGAISSLVFYANAGNLTSGTILLYGVK